MARNKYPEETVNLILEKSLMLFMKKGYDNTSIQDIIDQLEGLSKGAIYHHFKSKEDIFISVCDKLGNENAAFYARIRDDKTKNGLEKLKAMIDSAYVNTTNDVIITMMDNFLNDPRFFTNSISEIYSVVAPQYIQPVIEEGIKDGSIQTDYPKELAEVMITLTNVWINPIIAKTTPEQARDKMNFFCTILKGIGLDIITEDAIESYVLLCQKYKKSLIGRRDLK